jgi:hypothetical protein
MLQQFRRERSVSSFRKSICYALWGRLGVTELLRMWSQSVEILLTMKSNIPPAQPVIRHCTVLTPHSYSEKLMNEYNNPSFATMFQRALLNTCITTCFGLKHAETLLRTKDCCTHSLLHVQQDALTQYKNWEIKMWSISFPVSALFSVEQANNLPNKAKKWSEWLLFGFSHISLDLSISILNILQGMQYQRTYPPTQ